MAVLGWILVALILFFLLLWLPKNLATYLTKSWFENYPDWAKLLPSYHRMFWNPRRWTVISWLGWLQKKLTKQLEEVNKKINHAEALKAADPEFASLLVNSGVYDKIQEWINSPSGREFKKVIDEINKSKDDAH